MCNKFEVSRKSLDLLSQSQRLELVLLAGHSERRYERVCCQGIGSYNLNPYVGQMCIFGLELSSTNTIVRGIS
jgi:hypothetical protein